MEVSERRARAVARGARLLDRKIPRWYQKDRINVDKLDLGSACDCVGGQLARFHWGTSWHEYLRQYAGVRRPVRNGFVLSQWEIRRLDRAWDSYEELTELWRDEILRRRAARDHGVTPDDIIVPVVRVDRNVREVAPLVNA